MLAPGLCSSFKVKLIPEKNEDYHYEFKFATDTGELLVPVLGWFVEFIFLFITNFAIEINSEQSECGFSNRSKGNIRFSRSYRTTIDSCEDFFHKSDICAQRGKRPSCLYSLHR